MPFELPVFRARMLAQFSAWEAEYRGNALREDAYQRVARILQVLQAVTPMEDEAPIPPDSVLREFIGGSMYDY